MPTGNGAHVVHKTLSRHLDAYQICSYPPNATLFPLLLLTKCRAPSSARLIHTTPDYAGFFARKKTPLVVTFHNYVLDPDMQPYGSRLQRLHWRTDLRWSNLDALRRADVVTAVSDFTAKIIKRDLGFKGQIRSILNGVDAEWFRPAGKQREGAIKVLFSGNPSSRKGGQWLPAIVSKLDRNIELVCTGGLRGNDRLKVSERIRFLGKVPYERMPDLYRDVDILLLPTVREGLSLAILEAMASGLPVVSSRCSSVPEQIEDGVGGVLVEPGDIDGYAEGINRLAASRKGLLAAGAFNRARVEQRFTLQRMVKEYRILFESILDGEING
jgi:glycosyltransferase involved in cell wall biosynthesis